jgi:hypothetical protein
LTFLARREQSTAVAEKVPTQSLDRPEVAAAASAPNPWLARGERFLSRPTGLAFVLLLFIGLFALHRPDGVINPQLWAEDGPIFHQDAELFGWRSLFIPRMGYFHTIPRLIALTARHFDPAWTPAIYTYSALLISGLAALCLVSSRMPGERLAGFGVGLILVIVPNYSNEIFLTPTNLQWVIAPLLTALLVREPAPTIGWAFAEGLAVFVIGTSTPFSIALIPLVALWVFWKRDRRRLLGASARAFAALVQAAALLSVTQGSQPTRPVAGLGFLAQVVGLRIFAETFTPQIPCETVMVRILMGLLALGGLVGLAGLPGKNRPVRLMLVAIVIASLTAAIARCRSTGVLSTLIDTGFGDRYFYAVRTHLLWCCLLAGLDSWATRRWLAILCSFLLCLAVISSLRTYRVESLPDLKWKDYVPALREGRPVSIPINPSWTYNYPGRPGGKFEVRNPNLETNSNGGKALER